MRKKSGNTKQNSKPQSNLGFLSFYIIQANNNIFITNFADFPERLAPLKKTNTNQLIR